VFSIEGPHTGICQLLKKTAAVFSQRSLVITGRYIGIAISCMALHISLIILKAVVSPIQKLKAIDLNKLLVANALKNEKVVFNKLMF
jgi:hypothetical protein